MHIIYLWISAIKWNISHKTNEILPFVIAFNSVQSVSHVQLFATPCTPGLPVHHQLPESTQTHDHWVSNAIRPSHPLSSPSPVLNLYQQMSQLFSSGDQSIGASASTSVLPMNIQSWVPLGLTCLISLQSKGLSRAFSSTVRKHQFFGAQPSLSNSHICIWLLEI